MATTVTVKGQVTLPKAVREAVGIQPGDRVEVRATASGGIYIEKLGAKSYRDRLLAIAKKYPMITDRSTDEIMRELRGDPSEDPPL
jgi:AbrB family looped-hinge helix DNA binding protein